MGQNVRKVLNINNTAIQYIYIYVFVFYQMNTFRELASVTDSSEKEYELIVKPAIHAIQVLPTVQNFPQNRSSDHIWYATFFQLVHGESFTNNMLNMTKNKHF